jgi:hypothetical protein
MLEAALLWYKNFRHELQQEGFKFNPYDPCVTNDENNGSQQMLLFHVDDLKSSHTNLNNGYRVTMANTEKLQTTVAKWHGN